LSYRGSSWLSVNELVTVECDRQAVIERVLSSLCTLQGKEGTATEKDLPKDLEVQQDEVHAARWKEKIFSIVNEIENGTLDKLVLARSVKVHSPQLFDPGAVVQKLRVGYSHCTLFAFASRQRCFIGATPERLVRLEGKTVRTDCLAGSTRRGATDDEDRAFGE